MMRTMAEPLDPRRKQQRAKNLALLAVLVALALLFYAITLVKLSH
jgi:hypothetical protein